MGFDAGSIIGKLGLDLSGYAQGMLQAQTIASLFPSVVTDLIANPLLGIISIAEKMASAVKGAFFDVAHGAKAMGTEAERAGVSVEFLSTVGKSSSAGVEGLADAFKFLNRNLADAVGQTEEAAKLREVFQSIGVSQQDLQAAISGGSDGLEALFYKVEDGVKGLGSTAAKTKLTMDLLGRGGTDLIPTLNKGSAATKAMAAEIAGLGGGVTASEVALARKVGKIETLFSAAMEGIKKAVAEPLLEAFGDNVDAIKASLIEFAAVAREGVAKAIEVLKPLVIGLWDGFKGLAGFIASVVAPIFNALVPVLKIVGEILGYIFGLVGNILGGIGSIVRDATDAVGLTSSKAAGSSSGSNKSNSAGVNIENVSVNGVDVATASSAIAAKLQPQIAAGQRAQSEQLQHAAQGAKVSRAVRGK